VRQTVQLTSAFPIFN